MSWLEAILLGTLQGLTEFLPVSSSGHLEIGKVLLGVEDLQMQEYLCDLVIKDGLSVRQLEEKIAKLSTPKKKLQEEIQGTDYVKYIDGKEAGVSLIGSYVNRNELSVLVNYKINPSFSITGRAYRMSNRLYLKMWNGYQAEQEEKEEYVYITEYGTVYHLTMDCTHLNLSVQAVSAINLTVERNEYGKKYKACEKCITGNEKTAYYITDKGDKYHEILSCSGLKRTVTCVPESIVEDWPVCSMCGKMGK